jgi:uncharacterized protein YkwD
MVLKHKLYAICKSAAWCAVVFSALIFSQESEARESYAATANRLLSAPSANARYRPDLEALLHTLANRYRARQKAEALRSSSTNQDIARAQAMDMALHEFVGHVASTGQGFDSRVRALRPGILFLPVMAENAAHVSSGEAATGAKAAKMMEQWINSPPHRKTLANRSYRSVATGVVQKGNLLYAVQVFSGPEMTTNLNRPSSRKKADLY